MKSRIWFAFMIAMLLVSPVAFGEIVNEGDYVDDEGHGGYAIGDWGWAFVMAKAEGDDTMSWGMADGEETWYTTEATYCLWEYHFYAYAKARVYFYDVLPCYSFATVEVTCYEPKGDNFEREGTVLVDDDDYEGESPVEDIYGEQTHDVSDNGSLGAFDSVDGDYLIGAIGAITTGSDDWTYSEAIANTLCRMWLP